VIFLERRGDPPAAAPFPGEEGILANPTPKRLAQFRAGRDLARQALARLGYPPQPIGKGPLGEPLLPAGAVGSLTHTKGYWACAVAAKVDFRALGLDAEPNVEPPARVQGRIATPPELEEIGRLPPGPAYLRLLFCAKEALYKAACSLLGSAPPPLTLAVTIAGGPTGGSFALRTNLHPDLGSARCRWQLRDGVLVCAVAVGAER
jgi:4'-phosphopantetheinyl transferase EntD